MVHSDRDGEYFSNKFDPVYEKHGIIHKKSAPFTSQKNGFIKRKNRTLTNMIKSMLLNAKLSNNIWGETLLIAYQVHNWILSMKTLLEKCSKGNHL